MIDYEERLENKMIEKGFGEKDSHDEDHVRKVVCEHFNIELTDDWNSDCDHYIFEESTADGYSVYVSTYDDKIINVNENVFYYENDLSNELKQAMYDNDQIDAKIFVSMLNEEYWVQDAIQELYMELVDYYTNECKDELEEEGYPEPNADILNLIGNNK